jgi:hypothetical protein
MKAILAAAHNAALQPTGQYWQVDQVQGQSYIVRAATGAYAITGSRDETFSWWGRKPGMGEAFYDRTLAAAPVTARDTTAWHKAGSPSSFRVWTGDHWDTFTTAATTWQAGHPNPQGGGDFPGAAGLAGPGGLQSLPTDPGKLAKMFFSPKAMAKAGLLGNVSPGAKVAMTSGLLDAPLPPKVASGLIQALASQPGVHAIGNVTDPLGRQGVALAADAQAATITGQSGTPAADLGTYSWRQILIFSPATGALLAQEEVLTRPGGPYSQEHPGFVIYYLAIRSAGWTATKPAAPAQLSLRAGPVRLPVHRRDGPGQGILAGPPGPGPHWVIVTSRHTLAGLSQRPNRHHTAVRSRDGSLGTWYISISHRVISLMDPVWPTGSRARLAGALARDGTDALPDVGPPDRLDALLHGQRHWRTPTCGLTLVRIRLLMASPVLAAWTESFGIKGDRTTPGVPPRCKGGGGPRPGIPRRVPLGGAVRAPAG